jgi:hypothetical protein
VSTIQTWGSTQGASLTIPAHSTGENDTAEVLASGSSAAQPGGLVTFNLYPTAACAGSPVFSDTEGVIPSDIPSAPVTQQLPAGNYYWTVAYSGDSNFGSSTSPCGSEKLTVLPSAPTSVTTFQYWGSTRGASITVPAGSTGEYDTAEVLTNGTSGVLPPEGNLTFKLYSNTACTGKPVFSTTQPTAPDGFDTIAPPITQQLSSGDYYWTVAYSGDGTHQPSNSPCGSEKLTVAPVRILSRLGVISPQALTLTMSCTAPLCSARITVTLLAPLRASHARQQAQRKPPVITLARGTVTIRRHSPQTVRLRLTAAGRRFVASHNGQVTVNAAVATTIHGHTRVLNQRLKIKITKPSKRKQA